MSDDAKRREELHRQLHEYRRQKLARVFGRARWARRIVAIFLVASFALWAGEAMLERGATLDSYHHLCRQSQDGGSLEAARGLASERRMSFDQDPETRSRDVFVLRPYPSWPFEPGCRFEAREARVYRLSP